MMDYYLVSGSYYCNNDINGEESDNKILQFIELCCFTVVASAKMLLFFITVTKIIITIVLVVITSVLISLLSISKDIHQSTLDLHMANTYFTYFCSPILTGRRSSMIGPIAFSKKWTTYKRQIIRYCFLSRLKAQQESSVPKLLGSFALGKY